MTLASCIFIKIYISISLMSMWVPPKASQYAKPKNPSVWFYVSYLLIFLSASKWWKQDVNWITKPHRQGVLMIDPIPMSWTNHYPSAHWPNLHLSIGFRLTFATGQWSQNSYRVLSSLGPMWKLWKYSMKYTCLDVVGIWENTKMLQASIWDTW